MTFVVLEVVNTVHETLPLSLPRTMLLCNFGWKIPANPVGGSANQISCLIGLGPGCPAWLSISSTSCTVVCSIFNIDDVISDNSWITIIIIDTLG